MQAIDYINKRINELGKVDDVDTQLAIAELVGVRFILTLPQPSNVEELIC